MANASNTGRGKVSGLVGWIIFGLLLWLAFVISQTPAIWAASAMTQGGQLSMSGVTGTLWRGRASLASFRVENQDYSLGELRWRLEPLSLLSLSPCAQLHTQLDRQEIEGRVCAGLGNSLELQQTTISAPASLLQANLPLTIDGQIFARIEQMRVKGDFLQQLKGNLSWSNARIHNGKTWMNLGSHAANMQDDSQGGIQLEAFHLDGPLQLDMDILLAAGGGGSVRGHLTMNPEFMREAQADAWIAMVTSGSEADAEGNTRYQVELEF